MSGFKIDIAELYESCYEWLSNPDKVKEGKGIPLHPYVIIELIHRGTKSSCGFYDGEKLEYRDCLLDVALGGVEHWQTFNYRGIEEVGLMKAANPAFIFRRAEKCKSD